MAHGRKLMPRRGRHSHGADRSFSRRYIGLQIPIMKTSASKPLRGRPVNERAREERMTKILDGARKCFVKRGFHASSISEISTAAEVSTANIYQYFPSKDALIIALIEVDLQRHHSLISKVWSTDYSSEAIENLMGDIFLTAEGHALAVLRAEIASEGARNSPVAALLQEAECSLMDNVRRNIRTAQEQGKISGDLDPNAIAERLSLVFEGLMRLYLFSPSDGEKLIQQYYDQFSSTLHLER